MNEHDLPQLQTALLDIPSNDKLRATHMFDHPPRILLLYGSLRARSFSRLMAEESARL